MKAQLSMTIIGLALMISLLGTSILQDPVNATSQSAQTGQVWGFPVNISSTPGKSKNPVIAVGVSGTLHVVWEDDTLGNWEVFYTYKPVGGVWQPPVNISNTAGTSSAPDLVVDNDNALHVVWTDSSPYAYLYVNKPEGGSWSSPTTVFSTGVSFPRAMSIAADGSNTLHVAGNKSEDHFQGFYSTKPPGGVWSDPQRITNRADHCTYFEIATDGENAPHVVWDDSDSWNILYSTLQGSSWSIPVQVSDSHWAQFPSMAIGSNSGIHVVWRDYYYSIYYAEKPYGGSWSDPIALHDQMYHSMEYPDIAVDDANARVWAAWGFEEYVNAPTTIYFTVREHGVWSPPAPLADMYGEHPCVGVDSEGRAYVVWDNEDDIYYIGPGHRVYLPLTIKE